jgi:hypothetical protein
LHPLESAAFSRRTPQADIPPAARTVKVSRLTDALKLICDALPSTRRVGVLAHFQGPFIEQTEEAGRTLGKKKW